jgi:UDP-4-amino-4,6-dideoxy-N-acetyl-beta-L-altrosamine transaminase
MISYGKQDITKADIEEVIKVLRSDFLTQGPAVPFFEKKLCNYTGAKYAVAVNSCTSALHLSCLALGLGTGDILWTSPITFVASANCALYCGATVDFIDIEPDTALMSVEKLAVKLEHAEKKGKLPKIVIPVHFAGQPCDMKEIYALSQKYGFKIIEDAAHAIGSRYQNEPIGNCRYSDITVFSFHPVKIITTGEGGAVMTNNSLYAEKVELLRSHGITRDLVKMHNNPDGNWYYEQIDLGFNYRMTDIQAALGGSQIDRIEKYVSRRLEITKWYNNQFKDTCIVPLAHKKDRSSSNHIYVVSIENDKLLRKDLYEYLIKNGIGANVHYIPIHTQYFYNKFIINTNLPLSEEFYNRTITLPLNHVISDADVEFIARKVIDFIS